MKKLLLASAAVIAISFNTQAYDRDMLLIGLGADNLRDSTSDGKEKGIQAPEARIEWRGKEFDNLWGIKNISPMVGFEAATTGAYYGFAGLAYDWNFYGDWSLVPNLALGFYHEGEGKDLGGWFEFHDSIGIEYKVSPSNRVGLELTHMSNASINDKNPGKEDLILTYSLGL